MNGGLILLSDEEQRILYASPPTPAAAVAARPSRPPQPRRQSAASSNLSHPRSSLPSNGGASAGHPSDFAVNHGLPRTNFTTKPSVTSLGKPSSGTFNSSPRTNFTRSELPSNGGGARPTDVIHDDGSYPMLRDDARSSFSSTTSDHDEPANRYAGTSSGLKISVTWIMVGVAIGVALGLILSQFHVSPVAARWVSLPGDLFLRALKCLVIPYVFCAVAVAIGDIVFVGKVSIVGMQTFRMFALFWVSSAAIGMTIALSFRPLFRLHSPDTSGANKMGFTCSNGQLLAQSSNGTVACTSSWANGTLPAAATFVVSDRNNAYSTNTKSLTLFTLTDQLIAMITPLVSKNIIATLAAGDLLSTITFAMVLGAIAGRSYFMKTRRVNYLYLTLLQLRNTFFLALEWIIWLSPFAVISMIAGSFAANEESISKFGTIYVYVLAGLTAGVLQMMVVFPLIVFLLTRCNPYNHMSKMLRAYMFAFACSSSLATAPVTLTCVRKAKVCSQSLANFVISIGVCSNLSAVGWYVPIAIVFIAESSGNGDQLTPLRLVGIFVLSVLQCAGTAPIPSGVLVSIATIYTSLFGVSSVPETFAYVTAMDFIIDRFVTVCDVNDDIMCLKVIAENTDETVTQEQLGERE